MAIPDPFAPAIRQMISIGAGVLDPVPFQEYLRKHGLPRRDTAQAISVDFVERLAPSLREHGVMVLRLGSDGQGTRFTLVGPPARLHDFFLHDSDLFGSRTPERFEPEVLPESLLAYRFFGTLTETSMVNLAFASGLIGHALNLDPPYPTAAPATGSSTYDFRFRPHSTIDRVLEHTRGQVEIDAAFIGWRAGRPHLFILEAQSGTDTHTLAKHKLAYPVLALAPKVPEEIPIIPVYVRIVHAPGQIFYHIAECQVPDPRSGVPVALDLLVPVSSRCLYLSPG